MSEGIYQADKNLREKISSYHIPFLAHEVIYVSHFAFFQ